MGCSNICKHWYQPITSTWAFSIKIFKRQQVNIHCFTPVSLDCESSSSCNGATQNGFGPSFNGPGQSNFAFCFAPNSCLISHATMTTQELECWLGAHQRHPFIFGQEYNLQKCYLCWTFCFSNWEAERLDAFPHQGLDLIYRQSE